MTITLFKPMIWWNFLSKANSFPESSKKCQIRIPWFILDWIFFLLVLLNDRIFICLVNFLMAGGIPSKDTFKILNGFSIIAMMNFSENRFIFMVTWVSRWHNFRVNLFANGNRIIFSPHSHSWWNSMWIDCVTGYRLTLHS